MELLILAVLLGFLPACIARSKGRSFIAWWAYGALIFIVALPHAVIMKPDHGSLNKRSVDQGDKICPFCAETVKGAAIVCRYCGRDLPPPDKTILEKEHRPPHRTPSTDFEISL